MSTGVAVASICRVAPPWPLVVAVPMIAATFPWPICASDSSETTIASLPFSSLKKYGDTAIW